MVTVGVVVPDGVLVTVLVGVLVDVFEGVKVFVGVLVCVEVLVTVGVFVGVTLFVGVFVGVTLLLGVFVGVFVLVGVREIVGVLVGDIDGEGGGGGKGLPGTVAGFLTKQSTITQNLYTLPYLDIFSFNINSLKLKKGHMSLLVILKLFFINYYQILSKECM